MYKYAILQNPGHNRVYFDASTELSRNELIIASKGFSTAVSDISSSDLAGVRYIFFECGNELTSEDISIISGLSFAYALFELREPYLVPIEKEDFYIGDDLSMILKYSGKTNELFTRMLINIAVFSGDFAGEKELRILDPLCGKGTTLFEALMRGYHAYGIEINAKQLHEAVVFFKKYLETGKYKHEARSEKHTRDFRAERHIFEYARSKDDFKQKNTRTAEFIACDSVHADKLYKRGMFHSIICDLPYGVQHSDKHGMRNPKELLASCLPSWVNVLKPGGSIVMAWNSFVLRRGELEELIRANRLQLLEGEAYGSFAHRVDQAINRDIIVGVRSK